MYSVYIGFTHPRISNKLKEEVTIYNISDYDASLFIFRNLMNKLVKDRSKKLDFLFDDFFTSRAIDLNTNNYVYKNIKDFYEIFKYNFELKKKNGMKFFLLDVSEDRTLNDVVDVWHCSRLNYVE
jgi:hypothetical protein